jgi:hypothetical protein
MERRGQVYRFVLHPQVILQLMTKGITEEMSYIPAPALV